MNTDKILVFIQKLPTTLAAILLITWSKPYSSDLPLPHLWGYTFSMPVRLGLTAVGGAFLYYSLFYIKPKKIKKIETYNDKICPKCSEVFIAGYIPEDDLCSKCKIPLEPLKDFYKRHPELKDLEETPPEIMNDIK
ncbi:hypothetical protein SAMN05660337_0390 [Maridesulfovibrio ferrireducens]|uniref:Uncharacterized protein n=1 Tax=Maridesulfovibrio ferrireducens TaxID=246191 RepID=A0A1G9BS03_9BACT|nr:hypothetical protein [Maridesulfovibrio ferrireducens]SDK41954.1 hypothetical protein SAMN05660337_0390 [Maridesulfovibrio ferrireducens]